MWAIGPTCVLLRGTGIRALDRGARIASASRRGAWHSSRYVCCDAQLPDSNSASGVGSLTSGNGKSRAYPTEPRVGVGVVVFRTPPIQGHDPEVLLVRRAKEPDKGRWCFPGGSLELGEELATCAAREVEEEAGLRLHGALYDATPLSAGTVSTSSSRSGMRTHGTGISSGCGAAAWGMLGSPTPFAAVDVMARDPDGRIRYHYAVIEVAAVLADPDAVPVPGDDADGAQWVRVSRLRGMADLTVRCDEMAEEAVRRFAAPQLPSGP